MLREQADGVLDAVKHAIGRGRIIKGNEAPDLKQIVF